MPSVFSWIEKLGPAGLVLAAIVGTAMAAACALGFILIRREVRRRYFQRRDARAAELKRNWEKIVAGSIPYESWRTQPLDRNIVEAMALDQLANASPGELEQLLKFIRSSGLLALRRQEAQTLRGWRRCQAMLALGRMRAPEAIPVLSKGLTDRDAETRVAAVRALGRIGTPEAAEPILDCLAEGHLSVPPTGLQNALINCCRSHPSILSPYLQFADDSQRALLARVLGEVANTKTEKDIARLAADPLPEVRASAARAIATARPEATFGTLFTLSEDPEWFVRLRAVVALGEMEDPRTLPILIHTLCDSNRYVRLRSAAALAKLKKELPKILERAAETGDRYAMQALISEVERSGAIVDLANALVDQSKKTSATKALSMALRCGSRRMLVGLLVSHPNWNVRVALAHILARSGDASLIEPLQALQSKAQTLRERALLNGVIHRLQRAGPGAATDPVEKTREGVFA